MNNYYTLSVTASAAIVLTKFFGDHFSFIDSSEWQYQGVTLQKKGPPPIFNCKSGNIVVLKQTKFIIGGNEIPWAITDVKKTSNDNFPLVTR